MTTKFKKSFSPMLICWNDIKIHLGFEDSYFVPPPTYILDLCRTASISGTRIREGIRDFITRCWNAGRSADTTLFLYVNGKDHNGDKIMVEDHLKRGKSLESLTDLWLATWGQD